MAIAFESKLQDVNKIVGVDVYSFNVLTVLWSKFCSSGNKIFHEEIQCMSLELRRLLLDKLYL